MKTAFDVSVFSPMQPAFVNCASAVPGAAIEGRKKIVEGKILIMRL
jgi:hypothetical protein